MTITWTTHLSGYTQALHCKQKTMTNFVNYFSSWSQRLQYKEYSDSLINHFSGWPQTLKRKQNEITSSPIIYLADHELYNTNRRHWQSHGSSTSPTAPERCNTNRRHWQSHGLSTSPTAPERCNTNTQTMTNSSCWELFDKSIRKSTQHEKVVMWSNI
jgi:hypothetical protein